MLSKYLQIYEDLKQKIERKEIPSHTFLPSENELMTLYHSSRDTIRKSLSLLQQNGYIHTSKGKGSLVLDHEKIAFPVAGLTSFKELSHTLPGDVMTIVHCFEKIPVTTYLKKELYMQKGDVYHIERIRDIDGEKIILDIDYINAQVIPHLTKEIVQDSIYEYIENDLGLKVSFAKKEITVIQASDQEKELLDMDGFDLLVCVKSYTYLEDATLFQYTESKHRPDKFRFVEFARRSHMDY
ncbi:trehalose operon repressor [Massilimicrobiota timonensis]|uniref:Trehalose operon repressor n=1 Tax=Massilimicrobiota timonensis TaxID=1776392 RepID=A0A1Y4T0R3_9FIRM|nr:trehalose operon repressor [Massilimicrobiota timonensis]OUQ35779.1 trehalose operon repressor [Massilimicrobiota timonensis]